MFKCTSYKLKANFAISNVSVCVGKNVYTPNYQLQFSLDAGIKDYFYLFY